MKENKLIDLSKMFAVDIVNLCTDIKENRKGNVLLNQLLRSGTSIGANVAEAERGKTRADFHAKMNIALKEAGETKYWLNLLHDSNYLTTAEFKSMEKDIDEIIAILVSICKKTQKTK